MENFPGNKQESESFLESIKNNHPEIFQLISENYSPESNFKLTDNNKIETEEGEYLNTSRVQELIKIAAAIKNNLPNVPENKIRLWRANRKGEVGKNPSYTNSLIGIALPFLLQYKGPLSYVDVDKEIAEKSLRTVAAAEGSEFMLPVELLSYVKIVGLGEVETQELIAKSSSEDKTNNTGWESTTL